MQDEIQKRFEIVPEALRYRLGWDGRHDAMARLIMDEFALTLPRDRELVRQLAFIRVQRGARHAVWEIQGPTARRDLRRRPRLVDWLAEQEWFRSEFPTLHQVIINFDAEN